MSTPSPPNPLLSYPVSNYHLSVCVADMGFPLLRAKYQPIRPDGTQSLITCGIIIALNNYFGRPFKVVEAFNNTKLLNHITYAIYDIRFNRTIYLLVPREWTVEDDC